MTRHLRLSIELENLRTRGISGRERANQLTRNDVCMRLSVVKEGALMTSRSAWAVRREDGACAYSKLQACQQTDSGCEAAPAPGRKLEQRSSYCSAAHLLMVARCRPTNLQSNICRSRLRALSAEGERSRWLRGNSVCTIFRGQQWVATWSSYLRVHIRSSRWLTRNSRPTGTNAVIEGCNSTSWREFEASFLA
jgi:hypothetical protein